MRNYGTYPSAQPTAAGASPRPTEKKPEKVEMIMRLCERCSDRICDRYYLEPRNLSVSSADTSTCRGGKTIETGVCGICGREGAAAYAVRSRYEKRKAARSYGARKDTRARWQEPWRER